MKLYKVMGNLWELSPYQLIYSDVETAVENTAMIWSHPI